MIAEDLIRKTFSSRLTARLTVSWGDLVPVCLLETLFHVVTQHENAQRISHRLVLQQAHSQAELGVNIEIVVGPRKPTSGSPAA
jgi:hypothetical protein